MYMLIVFYSWSMFSPNMLAKELPSIKACEKVINVVEKLSVVDKAFCVKL